MPVRVKICGITRLDDAEMSVKAGADALGFNFYEESKRFLRGDPAWLRDLPPFVTRVAVVVNVTTAEAAGRRWEEGLVDAVQLHGDETPALCQAVASRGVPMTRALRVRDETSLAQPECWGTRSLLLDACRPGAYGGTGERLDWDLAADFVQGHPEIRVVLSGGLTPDNVAEAVRRVRPYAVDVASGVEDPDDPGRKDPARVRAFVQAAKSAVG